MTNTAVSSSKARRIAELRESERLLTEEIGRLSAQAVAASDLGLYGKYEKLSNQANTLERICLQHAAERQALEAQEVA